MCLYVQADSEFSHHNFTDVLWDNNLLQIRFKNLF